MDRYIGLDAHASSCTLAVVGPSGKRLGSYVVETNAKALIEVLRGVPGSRRLCMEEGTLAAWLYEVLGAHVKELGVVGVRKSRGAKSDRHDAFGGITPLSCSSGLESRPTARAVEPHRRTVLERLRSDDCRAPSGIARRDCAPCSSRSLAVGAAPP